jgi:transposase
MNDVHRPSLWVGVDVSKKKFDLEAPGPYGTPLARALHEAGMVVAVENPARIQAFARTLGVRAKTDRVDARLVARYARQHAPHRSELKIPQREFSAPL